MLFRSAIDEAAPTANGQPHYANQHGMHLYVKDGWWVLKDIFTPAENSSIARLRAGEDDELSWSGVGVWLRWERRTRDVFFFTATAATEIYTLSLHDALPI